MIADETIGRFIVAAALDQELAPLKDRSLPNLRLLKTGMGVENAARTLRRCLEQMNPQAVFGIGFAGGLSPRLRIGDLVIARGIHGGFPMPVSPELLATAKNICLAGTAIHFGILVTVDEVLGEAKLKRALAASLDPQELGCVDMESSAIAQVCSEYRVPFLIVRCITDRVDEDLPIDFNRGRKSDGTIDSKKILLSVLARPWILTDLWQLHKRSKYCAENLALFVEKLWQLEGMKMRLPS